LNAYVLQIHQSLLATTSAQAYCCFICCRHTTAASSAVATLLLLQGVGLLQPGSPLVKFRAALEVFEEACKLEPSFAEVRSSCGYL
jgi:hypothetical protein